MSSLGITQGIAGGIDESLLTFYRATEQARFLTIDTEFQRDTHYYSQWSLLQLGGLDSSGAVRACVVDAISPQTDWSLVRRLIFDSRRVKVFHAAKQDLEILWRFFSALPQPLFDSQIATALLGFGAQCSYERLVRHYLNIEIDKATQYTDWQARPLSDEQVRYALGDVVYLAHIYPLLRKALEERDRIEWLEDLQKHLLESSSYSNDGSETWLRLSPRLRDTKSLMALRRLSRWREQLAQQRDKPRQWLCPDAALLELSRARPTRLEQINKIRTRGTWRQDKPVLEEILEQLRLSTSDAPVTPQRTPPLNDRDKTLVALLKTVQRFCADESAIAAELLANTQDLNDLVRDRDKASSAMLTGWRFDIFGKKALEFLEGRLSLSVTPEGLLQIKEIEPTAKTTP